jgi:hypothetical protein
MGTHAKKVLAVENTTAREDNGGDPEIAAAARKAQHAAMDAGDDPAVVRAVPEPAIENVETVNVEASAAATADVEAVLESDLDEDEAEFRQLRRDVPGVKGSSALGIVAIGVSKLPGKNEFFRTFPDFRPVVPIVNHEIGMEKQYFAVTDPMIKALEGIGITTSMYTLYLTVTSRGAVRVVPVRCAGEDGDQNEYDRTKEIGLRDGADHWVRLYTDMENRCYRVYPAPAGRFPDPIWPDLKPAKIFRLCFRDKGRLIDSTEHPLFLKWAARDHD